jgi:hypothetical protein
MITVTKPRLAVIASGPGILKTDAEDFRGKHLICVNYPIYIHNKDIIPDHIALTDKGTIQYYNENPTPVDIPFIMFKKSRNLVLEPKFKVEEEVHIVDLNYEGTTTCIWALQYLLPLKIPIDLYGVATDDPKYDKWIDKYIPNIEPYRNKEYLQKVEQYRLDIKMMINRISGGLINVIN